ncbi:MAG TPA: hypothetical protein VJ183_19915 [Chloroflexia bacterium]|nr:hypothetical protein [Chloroflexia bacterium]
MDKKRYEKEIEEILAKYDQESGRKERPKSDVPANGGTGGVRPSAPGRGNTPRRNGPSFGSGLKNIGAGQYMISAFGLAILAIFVRAFSPGLAALMVILAAVLFLVPVLLHRSPGGGAPQPEKRWRGQVIDFSTRRDVTNDPFAAIKRWFRRR